MVIGPAVNARNREPGTYRTKQSLRWFLLTISFFFFTLSGAEAEEKEEEKTVLEEIFVTEAPYSNPVTPVPTRYGTEYNVVTEEQIKLQDSLDFQSTLQMVPGVMFQSKNLLGSQTSHSLYVRGRGSSHPSPDLAIQFDGVPRYGALFGQVLGDSIAVSTIGGIEVYKSPQPSQFGSGYALVNVQPKYYTEEGQEVALSFSGGSYYTFDESLSGGVKKGPFDIYLSQSWVSTDGHVDQSSAEQQSYYLNTGYQLNREWNIRFLANYVSADTKAPMPDTKPTATNGVSWPGAEQYDTETFFTTFTVNHQYENFGGFLKVYWDDTDFDLKQELTNGQRYGSGTGGLWSRQEISLYGVRAREILRLWAGGEILVGADLDKTETTNTQRTYSGLAVPGINGGRAARVWDFPDTTLFSPYIAVSQMLGVSEGWHFIPSAGYRYFDHSEFENVSSYQFGLVTGYGHTDLNLYYSKGVNYPSPVALMNLVLTSSPVSNPSQYWQNLKPEVVDHYEVGLTHTWPKLASLGATAYYDKGKDRFQTYMFGAIPLQWNDPIGQYEIRGLELTGTLTPIKTLELFASATWLDAKATGNNGIEQDFLPYTPEFQFQAGFKWAFLNNFLLYMDLQYLSGLYQGTSARSGSLDFSKLPESSKLDDITLVNARISYGFDYKPWRLKNSEVFLAVNNIFNEKYEYAKGYPMPGITVFAGFTVRYQ
jgi:outer membrane receptor protein involved in Fe transport